jgi:hypothetical protein
MLQDTFRTLGILPPPAAGGASKRTGLRAFSFSLRKDCRCAYGSRELLVGTAVLASWARARDRTPDGVGYGVVFGECGGGEATATVPA